MLEAVFNRDKWHKVAQNCASRYISVPTKRVMMAHEEMGEGEEEHGVYGRETKRKVTPRIELGTFSV